MIVWLACSPPPPPPPEPAAAPLSPTLEERAADAVDRALSALDRQTTGPDAPTKLDVPMGLASLQRARPHPVAAATLARLVPLLDTGGDPRRRFWDPSAKWPADTDYTWVPTPGKRVTPNFALVEALYCSEHPLRPESVAWVCSDLRDDGGRISGHAAWILDVAVDQGCVARSATCLDALRDEIVAASVPDRDVSSTMARDLLGEQVLFGVLAGADRGSLRPAVERLLGAQEDDGSWAAAGDRSFAGVHATIVGAWALSEWLGPARG